MENSNVKLKEIYMTNCCGEWCLFIVDLVKKEMKVLSISGSTEANRTKVRAFGKKLATLFKLTLEEK